ncbi:hypothetical protein BT63DRAFT_414636 [Microthyrium microscopicum]|uniref:FHA domain-containing protein n=1 Tax=Microthyrium microscopicum TaxID=703497 RepID=A0A6A6U9M3_9PEZI|nr:hypothetical protein BT63DRAFT_414636 [Microthyrium microscopicum]
MSFFSDASNSMDRPLGVPGTISANSALSQPPNQPTRRPALLPAFEPISSSPPALARKRRFEDVVPQEPAYPTPVPTSSTGILTSSSPRRPGLQRTASTLSERAPLCDVPTVSILENGDHLYLGRSSNSCHYQLPYNRLISRRHVSVRYHAPTQDHAFGQIVIKCLGWNGCTVRCKARTHEIKKDEEFIQVDPSAEVMLDVMDTRVILAWPETTVPRLAALRSESPWASPSRRQLATEAFASSPPVQQRSPVSISPAGRLSRTLFPQTQPELQIYEDPTSDAPQQPVNDENAPPAAVSKISNSSFSSSSELSDNENEENEPIVHSFGPFGANIISRLDSFSANSPERKRKPGPESRSPQQSSSPKRQKASPPRKRRNESPIKNHVINQLAFSRVHAVPISAIFKNLPADLKDASNSPTSSPSQQDQALTDDILRDIVHAIPCIGEISRSGKDAAGKVLENEFYYMPERDENVMRRDAVTNGMGSSGLRSVRKNHKQYYWKKPRA